MYAMIHTWHTAQMLMFNREMLNINESNIDFHISNDKSLGNASINKLTSTCNWCRNTYCPWRLTLCLFLSRFTQRLSWSSSLPGYRWFSLCVISDTCKPLQDEINHVCYFSLRFNGTEAFVSGPLFFQWLYMHFLFDIPEVLFARNRVMLQIMD